MVEALFLVERTVEFDNNLRDGIKAVIINNDDGDTNADAHADADTYTNACERSTSG